MSRQINYYRRATQLMEELYKTYPQFSLGRHLSTALADYGDFWGITNKEFCFALEKYMELMALDGACIASQEYVDRIVEDGTSLFDDSLEEEDFDGD